MLEIPRHQPPEPPNLSGKEVGCHEDIHMCADKLLPRRGRLPVGSPCNAMALEDIAHRLITDPQAEVGQGSGDPVIAPGAIFPGYKAGSAGRQVRNYLQKGEFK